MNIQTERDGATLVIKAGDRVDGANAREFQDALEGAIDDADKIVVLDFEDLSYISSAGLRVVLLIARSLSKQDAKFGISSLSKPIREVFEISGFDKIIPIHDSQTEAVAKLKASRDSAPWAALSKVAPRLRQTAVEFLLNEQFLRRPRPADYLHSAN